MDEQELYFAVVTHASWEQAIAPTLSERGE
jgi:hypothetical protein